MAHERGQRGHVRRREAHPRADLRRDRLPDDAVVARPALADVVQQRGDQQQVGPVDVVGELGGRGRGLDQVPVDGEPVPGMALRAASAPGPTRGSAGRAGPPGPAAPAPDGGAPLASSRRKDQRTSERPRLGSGGLCTASTLSVYGESSRSARAAAAAARRSRPGSAAAARPGRAPPRRPGDHAVGERLPAHPPVPAARPADQRRLDPAPGLVGDEGQPAAGQAHLAQQGVLVGQAQGVGHRPLLLADEDVGGPAGAPAQLVADVEQERVRRPRARRAGSSPSWAAAIARSTCPSRRPP